MDADILPSSHLHHIWSTVPKFEMELSTCGLLRVVRKGRLFSPFPLRIPPRPREAAQWDG